MQPPTKKRKTQNIILEDTNEDVYEHDGFIVSDDDSIEIIKRKNRHRNRTKSYKFAQLTEDTKRMIAESRNKKYKPDIDIDQGVSDIDDVEFNSDSNDSHQCNKKRRLKRKIIEMEDSESSSEELNETNDNSNNFIVEDIINPINTNQTQTFENQKLYQLFGKKIYSFLNISIPNCDDYDSSDSDIDIKDNKTPNKTTVNHQKLSKTKSKFSIKLPPRQIYTPNNNIQSMNVNHINNTIQNKLIHRQISYPLFHNVTRNEAEDMLKGKDGYGKVIFRPSKRENYLEMTWNMHSDIFVHWRIIERNKAYTNTIGKTLIIKQEKYEDLDEIYCNLIQILNGFVNDMIEHKHFKYGDRNDIEIMLNEQINSSNEGCYAISFSYRYPGYFLLTCIARKRCDVNFEYIGITSSGYKFRNNVFETPSDLINYWKRQTEKEYLERKTKKSKK